MIAGMSGADTGTATSWQGAWSGIRRSCSGEDWRGMGSLASVPQLGVGQSGGEIGLHPSW